ncbi:MAG TPA: YceI family protein [Gammaproteobacteria bacterium]|nr:YceI family protein [Gammaproteobacteria bacterium]
MKTALAPILFLFLFTLTAAVAAPVTYDVDADHTHPSFEADHFGGLSVWRGLFKKTSGSIVMDKAAGTGTVDIMVDMKSATVGQDKVDEVLAGPDYFDAAKYPTARYRGTLGVFVAGAPTVVKGTLTLHGVTRPVDLKVLSFKCVPHPLLKREWCGADAYAVINREDFGMASGKDWGFHMEVTLRIQVEAIAAP